MNATLPGSKEAETVPERRGYLVNEYTGTREYFVLRGGVVRIRQSPRGHDTGSVYLAHGSQVTLLAGKCLELQSKVPYPQDFMLAAVSEHEAEGWHDAIQASIRAEQAKMAGLTSLLQSGCTMHKYNYSNSKRSRRYFWASDDGIELCWGRSKGEDTQKVNLRECIGIIYGPMTTTFQRCPQLEDPSWSCFSLLFMGRTVDLAVAGDFQVQAWFLGMQHLISRHGIGSMPMMSDAQFVTRKVQYKLMDAAHRHGLVIGRYLLQRVRALASSRGLTGLGSGALVSGGRLASPLEPWKPVQGSLSAASINGGSAKAAAGDAGGSSKKEKRRSSAFADSGSGLQGRSLSLTKTLRERTLQTETVQAVLQRGAGKMPSDAAGYAEAVRQIALSRLKATCTELEEETRRLSEMGDQLGPQAKAADKAEKNLRKLEKKFDEAERRRVALEQELKATLQNAEATSSAKAESSTAEVEAKAKSQQLQRRVEELEKRLHDAQGNEQAEQEAAKNRKQADAIAAAEQECLSLHQKIEGFSREYTKLKDAETSSKNKLAHMQDMNKKLDASVAPLREAVARLRSEHGRVRADIADAGRSFGSDITNLLDATNRVGEHQRSMDEKYKAAMEDRKKLHNQVLDLKGNIRVFVRVRPMNDKERQIEPEGEPTITYGEDVKIGVFEGERARRKWFEFDHVFAPHTTQNQLFEEAKPLATSVLDGYNVCVFAYGQTGSGKTHTMTGTPSDPGLNTRVLTELFRIRHERSAEYDIHICIAITEIYNETIRDLLAPSGKKLDVKMDPKGDVSVPGLTNENVQSVDDVLRCISDASKNRSVAVTDMNDQSSRSHSIVTVRTATTLRGGDTYMGKMHLIDLAGSENVAKSGVQGQGMKEAQNINKSLSALGDVIQSLVAKNPHTPYRNSKLTMMLKDSLGGDSKTLMIVQASPAQTNVTETLSSLNFAARARNVELGKAKRNVAG